MGSRSSSGRPIEVGPGVYRLPLLPGDRLNAYAVIPDQTAVTLIDCGLPWVSPSTVRRHLDTLGVPLSQVVRVIATHAHLDHVGGLRRVQRATLAQTAAHESDAPYLQSGHTPAFDRSTRAGRWANLALGFGFPPALVHHRLYDGEILHDAGLKVLHTPGHTPGHIALLHEDSRVLIVGDALYNFNGRLSWPNHATCSNSPWPRRAHAPCPLSTSQSPASGTAPNSPQTHGPGSRSWSRTNSAACGTRAADSAQGSAADDASTGAPTAERADVGIHPMSPRTPAAILDIGRGTTTQDPKGLHGATHQGETHEQDLEGMAALAAASMNKQSAGTGSVTENDLTKIAAHLLRNIDRQTASGLAGSFAAAAARRDRGSRIALMARLLAEGLAVGTVEPASRPPESGGRVAADSGWQRALQTLGSNPPTRPTTTTSPAPTRPSVAAGATPASAADSQALRGMLRGYYDTANIGQYTFALMNGVQLQVGTPRSPGNIGGQFWLEGMPQAVWHRLKDRNHRALKVWVRWISQDLEITVNAGPDGAPVVNASDQGR